MLMVIVAVLIIVVIGLIIYNLSIHKKIQTFRNINQKITNFSVPLLKLPVHIVLANGCP